MAVSLKVDTEDFPSIISMLGLGGSSPAAPTPDAAAAPPEPDSSAPPVDPSIGGAGDPAGQSDTANAAPEKNKLQTLREFLDPQPPPPQNYVMAAPGEAAPAPPTASRNMSAMPDLGSGAPQVADKKTFAQRHPVGSTLLRVALNSGEGGLIGSQFANAGQGFEAAKQATDPLKKKMEDAALAEKQAATAHQQATTDQLKSQVTINGVTMPFALALKYYPQQMKESGLDKRNQANIDSREGIAGDKNAIALRAKGLKANPAGGAPVPLTRDEMSETEQAHLDLQQTQQEYTAARTAVEKAKNDPNSPAYKAAIGRLQVAQQNANTALKRAGIEQLKYNADYLGTGPDGQALPGVPLTDNGTPVGIRTANITKPTGTTRSKADQAGVVLEQGNALLKQIDANPELYGVVAGRWNEFNAGKFGDASQAVRDAYTSLRSFAALQPALHGARGLGMMKEFEDAVGNMGNDPDGLKGSVQSLLRTARDFKKAGTMNTAPGGGAHPAATHVYDPTSGTIVPVKK